MGPFDTEAGPNRDDFAVIRPAGATFCLAVWIAAVVKQGFVLNDWDRELMGLFLGVFVGARIHATGR